MKPILAVSCRLESVEEAWREEHIDPVLLRPWKGASSRRSRASKKTPPEDVLSRQLRRLRVGQCSQCDTGGKAPLLLPRAEAPAGCCQAGEVGGMTLKRELFGVLLEMVSPSSPVQDGELHRAPHQGACPAHLYACGLCWLLLK